MYVKLLPIYASFLGLHVPPASRPKSPNKCRYASHLSSKISSSFPEASGTKRRHAPRQLSRSPIGPHTDHHQSRMYRRMKNQYSQNFVNNDSADSMGAQTPILEFATSPDDMCHDWSPGEIQAKRRLVRFHKIQVGCRLIVSCEPIQQDEYCENDSVISCIYDEENDTHVFTSVDIIFLLERLAGTAFPVDEKNRIRRNLEGFSPTTVSKNKPNVYRLFLIIMAMIAPMPRHIEKDIKVFLWIQLQQALAKILAKYVSRLGLELITKLVDLKSRRFPLIRRWIRTSLYL